LLSIDLNQFFLATVRRRAAPLAACPPVRVWRNSRFDLCSLQAEGIPFELKATQTKMPKHAVDLEARRDSADGISKNRSRAK
jgi:hypothetical protein